MNRTGPFEVACADGWTLRGELRSPPAPKAVAVVGHAMMVDRRTLDRPREAGLVSRLASGGVAVVWPDLRGHGESGPRPEEGGDWSYDDLVEQDVPALVGFARARFPGLPCFAIGHSLFGHVVLAHLARHPDLPLDGLVMLAGNAPNPDWRKRPLSWLKKGALIEAMHAFTLALGRLPIRRLGLGTDDEPRGYIADFSRMWRLPDWRARDGFSYFAALGQVRTPILALTGAADRLLAPHEDVRGLMSEVPHATVEVVGKQSGLSFDPDHMGLVLDARARPVWDRVLAFVLR